MRLPSPLLCTPVLDDIDLVIAKGAIKKNGYKISHPINLRLHTGPKIVQNYNKDYSCVFFAID